MDAYILIKFFETKEECTKHQIFALNGPKYCWEEKCKRIRLKPNNMTVPRDDNFELEIEKFEGHGVVRIWCHECGEPYGSDSCEGKIVAYTCFSNFFCGHIQCENHERRYYARRGLTNDKVGTTKHAKLDDALTSSLEAMKNFNETNGNAQFELVEPTLHEYKEKSLVKIRYKLDGVWLPLCPPRSDLVAILKQQILHSKTHLKAIAKVDEQPRPTMSCLPGRPCKKNVLDGKQQPISNFSISTMAFGTSKPSSAIIEDGESSMNT
ncbi:hypothetical protein L7F22_041685 [Adiantum nelumboides]|nr:hypothetical protein [Adiantum nelumboides]